MEGNRVLVFICLVLFFWTRCASPIVPKGEPAQMQPEKHTTPFSNPTLVYGSSFGKFFQSLLILDDFKTMLKFTSIQTRIKYGSAQLVSYYQNKFKFDFELGKLSNLKMKGDTFFLMYSNAQFYATRRLIRIAVIVENDSAKLILPNLNANPFY